jgi:hypothetical protein
MITAEDKPFGIRGSLIPATAFKDIKEDIAYDSGIIFSVHDKIIEVGYDKKEDAERAKKIAKDFIASWSFRNGIKVEARFNTSWKPDQNANKITELELHENIKTHDRVTTTVIRKGITYHVKQRNDSYSFTNDTGFVKKTEQDKVLSLVLKYFYEEVLEAERPKGGIYRIVEELAKKLEGRENLAHLVGQKKKFINEIMESVQEHRHAWAWLRSNKVKTSLSEQECIDRARRLIQSYTESSI